MRRISNRKKKIFAHERMFWYRENSHKHVIIVPPLTLSSFFLSYFRFTRLSITMFVVYSLFSFVFLSCIHIHTAINTRALSSTRLFLYSIFSQNNLISISNILDIKYNNHINILILNNMISNKAPATLNKCK